jgi:hypothetical protein
MTDNEGNNTFVSITNKDIYNKLLDVETHVKVTNGRVTTLEREVAEVKNKSFGLWVSNNPKKFALICLAIGSVLTPILISDFRQPLLAAIFG